MKAAIVSTWITAVPGREREAIDYGREVDEFWAKMAAEGKCSEPEWFWATRGLNMWIVKGDITDLLALQTSPEAQRLATKGRLLLQNFEYDLSIYGREEMLTPFEEVAKELKFA